MLKIRRCAFTRVGRAVFLSMDSEKKGEGKDTIYPSPVPSRQSHKAQSNTQLYLSNEKQQHSVVLQKLYLTQLINEEKKLS